MSDGFTSSLYPASRFLDGSFTVDQLHTQFPPSASTEKLLAYCTDLFGGKGGPVMCTKFGSVWNWEPACAAPPVTMNSNSVGTLVPLKSSTTIFVTGALTANQQATLSTQYAWPGAPFRIKAQGMTLGLFGLKIAGFDSGLVSLLATSDIQAFFDASSGVYKQIT